MRRLSTSGVCVIASALLMAACTGMPVSSLARLSESRRLAAEILVQLTKAADAANRAVMADTDEASVAFANEARQATRAVQANVSALTPLLQDLGYTEEGRLLDEFRGRFAEYVALDGRILDLAVENSNLKAQRLSFGPARESADLMADAVKRLRPARAPDAARVDADAARLMLAVREIQALQAPHIAEADDAPMTRLEEQMARAQAAAKDALDSLERGIHRESRSQLAAARAALARFDAVNAEIVVLSRRNSNVHSLALSLGQKRTLHAACEESIRAIRASLDKRGFSGTR